MIYHMHLLTHDKWLRNLAIMFALIPFSFFLLFALGEMSEGDVSGLQHVVEVVLVVALMYLALKKPFLGGFIMFFSGFIFSMLYVAFTRHLPPQTMIMAITLFFLPLIFAGALFISFARGHEVKE